jgi:hypothetical protein
MTEKLRKIIRSFKIDEVSAVRKPASEFATVRIMKSDTRGEDTAEQDLEVVRKLASDGLLADFEKHQFIGLIHDRAADIRRDGETVEKSFTRCIESDPCGRELYSLMKAAPGNEVAKAKVERDAPEDTVARRDEPATVELELKAKELAHKTGLSYAQAYTRIIDNPKYRRLRDDACGERQLALVRSLTIGETQALTPTKPFPREARGN